MYISIVLKEIFYGLLVIITLWLTLQSLLKIKEIM
jgi:hypothetical protein